MRNEETVAQLAAARGSPQPDSGLEESPAREWSADVFGNGREQKAKNDAALTAGLYQDIVQLEVERDFLEERSAVHESRPVGSGGPGTPEVADSAAVRALLG